MCGDAGRWAIDAIEAIETIEAIEGIALRGWRRRRRRRRRGWFRCTPQKGAFIALLNEGALALLHFAGIFSLNIALFA